MLVLQIINAHTHLQHEIGYYGIGRSVAIDDEITLEIQRDFF